MPNRLINEKSPYLIKHAHNPVDWHPWGDEAFALAQKEDKPVFLSIGYTTCHWCNVMEEESFNDSAIGKLLNEAFICIKVDREERPDVDAVYMAACQVLNGSGGWPLTVLLDHERRPFFAGTYYPKETHEGRIGMTDLIPRIKYLWLNGRDDLIKSAQQITEAIGKPHAPSKKSAPAREIADAALRELSASYDKANGGFGRAPKFPTPHVLMLLMRQFKNTGEQEAIDMALSTLRAMRRGGIYDHLGGGIHRYSTDERWLLPHFEKMLYDQALFMMACTEAYLITKDEEFSIIARATAECVLRDFLSPSGGFFSAWGADSKGADGKMHEGSFYLFSLDEIRRTTGEKAEEIIAALNLKENGNFTDPFGHAPKGTNVLHLARDAELPGDELNEALGLLHQWRSRREPPELDNKILTDWNGLMVAALAFTGRALNEPEYTEAAAGAAEFVLVQMRPEGRLMHRSIDGQPMVEANADDYAYFIWGFLELHQATLNDKWLDEAGAFASKIAEGHWDSEAGGFWFTRSGASGLPVRRKETYDGAVPSANSVMLMNLARLWRLSGKEEFGRMAEGLRGAFSEMALESPISFSMHITGALMMDGICKVTVEGRAGAPDTEAMLNALSSTFLPHVVVRFIEKDRPAQAMVCTDTECRPPVSNAEDLMGMLGLPGGRE